MFERSQRVVIIVDACIVVWNRESKDSIDVVIKRSERSVRSHLFEFREFFWINWSRSQLISMNVWNWCRWTCEIDVDWLKSQLMSIDVSIDVNERAKLMSMNVRNRCRLIRKSVEVNRRVDWVSYWRKKSKHSCVFEKTIQKYQITKTIKWLKFTSSERKRNMTFSSNSHIWHIDYKSQHFERNQH